MTFENTVVGIAMLLYASVAISYACKGNGPWAMVWLCYAAANLGLIWAASQNR